MGGFLSFCCDFYDDRHVQSTLFCKFYQRSSWSSTNLLQSLSKWIVHRLASIHLSATHILSGISSGNFSVICISRPDRWLSDTVVQTSLSVTFARSPPLRVTNGKSCMGINWGFYTSSKCFERRSDRKQTEMKSNKWIKKMAECFGPLFTSLYHCISPPPTRNFIHV